MKQKYGMFKILMTFYCSFRFPLSLMKFICGYDKTLHKMVCTPEESKVL